MKNGSNNSVTWTDWKAFCEARREEEALQKHKERTTARRTEFPTSSEFDPSNDNGHWERLDRHNRDFKFSEKRNYEKPHLHYELYGDRSKLNFHFKLYRTLIITDHLNLDPYLRSRVCDRVISKKHNTSGVSIESTILIESAIAMYEDPRLKKDERRVVSPRRKPEEFDPVLRQMIDDCGVHFRQYQKQFNRYLNSGKRGEFTYNTLAKTSRDRHYMRYVRYEEPLPWVEPDWSASKKPLPCVEPDWLASVETEEVYKPTSMVYSEGSEANEKTDRDQPTVTTSGQDPTRPNQTASGES